MPDYRSELTAMVVGLENRRTHRVRREAAAAFGVSAGELEEDLAATRRQLERLPVALYCCDGPHCCRRRAPLPELSGLPVIPTGCQGACKLAPLVTLAVAGQRQWLAGVDAPAKARAAVELARRAQAAGSLLVDAGEAQPLLADPHHPAHQPPALLRLSFLAGRLRGEGRTLETGETFLKEVEGRWEAGGRYLALRQRAAYGDDVHSALVIVKEDEAWAFRDDGRRLEYRPVWEGAWLVFEDLVPHHARARTARKRIRPTPAGYEEVLEVSRDGQTYQPYYEVLFKRCKEACHAVV